MKSPFSRFTVSGNSMFPTLRPGQDVLSINWFVSPKKGDILVIKQDGKEMVKRVQKVDGSKVFVIGDNEQKSTDSRHFGSITLDQIVGKIVY